MKLEIRDGLAARAVAVSDRFIDEYMAAANGEYVKVFLYLLRHADDMRPPEVTEVADALNHTEADVRRALAYWRKVGLLEAEEEEKGGTAAARETAAAGQAAVSENPVIPAESVPERAESGPERAESVPKRAEPVPRELPPQNGGTERLARVSEDEEFCALLYAVQRYLGKTFTQIECEKFAYFYDSLHMSGELLEYLAEYCAGGGHTGIRYIEKVALNWYQQGITTREAAKAYTLRYSRDVSAVMKAFGIAGRNPAEAELTYMRKWFKEFGFDRKLVSEACARTVRATGTISFPYADKILSGWKEKGVRVLGDVGRVDQEYQERRETEGSAADGAADSGTGSGRAAGRGAAGAGSRKAASRAETADGAGAGRRGSSRRGAPNRFKNFDERANHYEDYIWKTIRERNRKEAAQDGTQ